MASDDHPSQPRPVLSRSPQSRGRSEVADSESRATSTARLASPVPNVHRVGSPLIRQVPALNQTDVGTPTEFPALLPGAEGSNSLPGPGPSALAEALKSSFGQSPPRYGTPPMRASSPFTAEAAMKGSGPQTTYGSFEQRSFHNPFATYEDPEIVKRHLVLPSDSPSRGNGFSDIAGPSTLRRGEGSRSNLQREARDATEDVNGETFSSLQLQGGDVTRQVYKWTAEAEAQALGRGQRSQSFHLSRPPPESEVLDINNIKVPGGFRRNYLRRTADSPASSDRQHLAEGRRGQASSGPPKLFTSNFIEFLSLYGHFAGEELEEDDEVLGPDEYFSSDAFEDGTRTSEEGDEEEDHELGEDSALLTPGRRKRKRKSRGGSGENGMWGAILLLLKSFVGTGVLFLPKAYLNGGMLFSNLVLLFVSALSYYCFVLLVRTRLTIEGSFGHIGGVLYGKHMRAIILFSIVLSQIGFVAAYIVFTSQNLQAFILAVSKCHTLIDIEYIILMQLVVFLPLSLIRDISKLGATALIADVLILLGLVYLYYYDILTIVSHHGVADIVNFNPRDWTLFIGTAIFTFEGIGLIIPIQETMKKPRDFPRVLGGVMIVITAIFISMGALSYAAYGSDTKTVVILNLPQDDKFVNAVQFFYSVAILLSTPLQLFPAIKITENELFARSGKYNPYIKWQKNVFRFFLVMLCAGIAWGGSNDLDKFVALVGSFACVPLVYVYPPLLHLKAVATSRIQKVADISLCIFGLIVMVYTTTLTVKGWADGRSEESPGYCG